MKNRNFVRSRMARAVAVGLLLGSTTIVPMPTQASQWTGAVSDDWSEADNWVVPPVNGSFVLIDALAPNPTHLRTAATVGTIVIGDQSQGALVIESGGALQAVGATLGASTGSNGSVVVSGAGSSFTTDGWASIGRDGVGSLTVRDGAAASLAMTEWYSETILGFGEFGWTEHPETGQGSIVVDGAGSTLDYAGGLNILNGSLAVSAGGQVTSRARDDAAWVDLTAGACRPIRIRRTASTAWPALRWPASVAMARRGQAATSCRWARAARAAWK